MIKLLYMERYGFAGAFSFGELDKKYVKELVNQSLIKKQIMTIDDDNEPMDINSENKELHMHGYLLTEQGRKLVKGFEYNNLKDYVLTRWRSALDRL